LTELLIFSVAQTDASDNGRYPFKQCCIRFILLLGRLYSYGFWLGFNGGNSARNYAYIDKVIERDKIKIRLVKRSGKGRKLKIIVFKKWIVLLQRFRVRQEL